jgi:nitroreductase
MELFEAIKGRRSIRKFKERKLDNKELNRVIEAGVWAPSAGNLQSWEVIVVKKEELKSKISTSAYMRDFICDAPVILVICANSQVSGSIYDERGKELYCIQDAACAAENMLLAAHALGLGACWIGSFDEDYLVELLEINKHSRPVAIIPLGYPDETPLPPPRDDIESFVHNEKY